MPSRFLHRTACAHLLQLIEEITQTKGTIGNLDGGLTSLFLIELLLRLLDQGKNIAHIEDSHTIRVETSKSSGPSPVEANRIGLPVIEATGKRGTATGVAIKLRKAPRR